MYPKVVDPPPLPKDPKVNPVLAGSTVEPEDPDPKVNESFFLDPSLVVPNENEGAAGDAVVVVEADPFPNLNPVSVGFGVVVGADVTEAVDVILYLDFNSAR